MFQLFNPRTRVPASHKAVLWVVLGWLAFMWLALGSSSQVMAQPAPHTHIISSVA